MYYELPVFLSTWSSKDIDFVWFLGFMKQYIEEIVLNTFCTDNIALLFCTVLVKTKQKQVWSICTTNLNYVSIQHNSEIEFKSFWSQTFGIMTNNMNV